MVTVDKVVRQPKSQGENINQGLILIAIEKKIPRQVIILLKSDKEKRMGANVGREQLRKAEQLLRGLKRYVKIREETDALTVKDDRRSCASRQREESRKDNKTVVPNVKTDSTFLYCVFYGQIHYNDMYYVFFFL